MKKLLYLGILLILGSCGSNVESTTTIVYVDGREVLTIKIGNLEVMAEDLKIRSKYGRGFFDFEEAKKVCENLGDGWRLPTKDELNVLYKNKDKIGGFAGISYWSSTEVDNFYAWIQDFGDGFQDGNGKVTYSLNVRAVRAF